MGLKKRLTRPSIGEDVEQLGLLHAATGNAKWYSRVLLIHKLKGVNLKCMRLR